ncbi:TPA: hypothetical protein DCE37_22800 [Candidatus Latescibacteria bacterium]|nr:hypothetical protein [Candidatus Latescibacterota bacterium]
MRTGVVSGLATDLMVKPNASRLCMLGSGVQARSHLRAVGAVRTLRAAHLEPDPFVRGQIRRMGKR